MHNCRVEENEYRKIYYDKNNQLHRLTGPAVEYKDGYKNYYINGINYMCFSNTYNVLYIWTGILELTLEYEKYIKQNIKNLISEYNPKIQLDYYFEKEEINELPNWVKDLFI